MSPKLKKTYMADVYKIRYDLLCDGCGHVMGYDRMVDDGGISLYKYDCPNCSFHRLDGVRYPIFIDKCEEDK